MVRTDFGTVLFFPHSPAYGRIVQDGKMELNWHFQRGLLWMLMDSGGQKHAPQLQSKVEDRQFHPCLSILRLLTPGMWEAVHMSLKDSPIPLHIPSNQSFRYFHSHTEEFWYPAGGLTPDKARWTSWKPCNNWRLYLTTYCSYSSYCLQGDNGHTAPGKTS